METSAPTRPPGRAGPGRGSARSGRRPPRSWGASSGRASPVTRPHPADAPLVPATSVAGTSLWRPSVSRVRPKPPLERVLDANGDGTIDAGEMANAVAALKKLDANGDGKLT